MDEENLKDKVNKANTIIDKLVILILYGISLTSRKKILKEMFPNDYKGINDFTNLPSNILNNFRDVISEQCEKNELFDKGELWQIFKKFLPRKDVNHIAKKLNFTSQEIDSDFEGINLSKRILETCNIIPIPHEILGIKFSLTYLYKAKNCAENPIDDHQLLGITVMSFTLLEAILGELIDYYLKWRFGRNKTKWGENLLTWLPKTQIDKDSDIIGKNIKSVKNNTLNLGSKKNVLISMNENITNSQEEKEELGKALNIDFLLPPTISTLTIPEESTEEYLKKVVDTRNRVIHLGDQSIDLSVIISQVYEFIIDFNEFGIFPKVFRQLSVTKDWIYYLSSDPRLIYNVITEDHPRETIISPCDYFDPSKEFYYVPCQYKKNNSDSWIMRNEKYSKVYKNAKEMDLKIETN